MEDHLDSAKGSPVLEKYILPFRSLDIETPAYVYDLRELDRCLDHANLAAEHAGCKLLYSLKACSIQAVLSSIAPRITGFACSSRFELETAKQIAARDQTLHFTSPGIRPGDFPEILAATDYFSANSINQWQHAISSFGVSRGIRVNPGISFAKDERYDPCRCNSKLGIQLKSLVTALNHDTLDDVEGLHFHTHCEGESFLPLEATATALGDALDPFLDRFRWINLGGGYYFWDPDTFDALARAVNRLRGNRDVQVYLEPGAGIVQSSGALVSTVVDVLPGDSRPVLVLDASVNHMPEVFEYQYQPDLMDESGQSSHRYILAGASCLAGDIFGEYSLDEPAVPGMRIAFEYAGAYTHVKSHMFNGINLPSIYLYDNDCNANTVRQYGYSDFKQRNEDLP